MKLNRIISLTSLAVSLAVLVLLFKRPQPVAPPQAPAVAAANAESFQNKISQLEKPSPAGAQLKQQDYYRHVLEMTAKLTPDRL